MDIPSLLGMGSIFRYENHRARFAGKLFNWTLLVLAVWLALQWHFEAHYLISAREIDIANRIVLGVYAFEFILLACLVSNHRRFLACNWMSIIIIILGSMLAFHLQPMAKVLVNFKPALVILLLLPWFNACRVSLSDNRLSTTMLTGLVLVALSGIFIAAIDPNINSLEDGIWWAWATVSTVGYGDVVPVSLWGRVFGAFLILLGLGLFSVLIANFSAMFMQKDVAEVKKESENIRRILRGIGTVKRDENKVLDLLVDTNYRIQKLEEKFENLTKEKNNDD